MCLNTVFALNLKKTKNGWIFHFIFIFLSTVQNQQIYFYFYFPPSHQIFWKKSRKSINKKMLA